MDNNKRPWPITTVCGLEDRIDTNPDFQRPAVWSRAQKQLLIDTILRGYDIPKLYWRKVETGPDRYEVVDGQQRLRAIWEFHAGQFSVPKKSDPVNGYAIAGLKYAGLPDDLRIHFDTYPLDVVVISETDEEEIREMFLRLQNGTSLKAQEKRNAMPGKMRDFVKSMASHPFFENCGFQNSRYTFDHIAAQMTLLEIEGGPCNVKNANLNKMYKEQKDFDTNCTKAKKVNRVLDYLLKCFPKRTPELERYTVISLCALVSQLLESFVVKERHKDLASWFLDFERYRREQHELPEDECDPEIVVYDEKVRHSTDSIDSIEWRHEHMMRKFFEAFPDIEQKDNQRLFTHEQRLAIFRRDNATCQLRIKCEGNECKWGHWEADHVVPWSKGGKTTVANGQVACPVCNSSKGGQGRQELEQ